MMLEKIKELVRKKNICVLATVSGNRPYCSLMAYISDEFYKEIYMVTLTLTMWKAKIFDVIRKADRLGSADLEKVLPNIQDLKMVITDLEDRIHQPRAECPLEWKPIREEIDGVKGNLTNTYDEVIDYIGGRAAPVDLPR